MSFLVSFSCRFVVLAVSFLRLQGSSIVDALIWTVMAVLASSLLAVYQGFCLVPSTVFDFLIKPVFLSFLKRNMFSFLYRTWMSNRDVTDHDQSSFLVLGFSVFFP